MRRTPLVVVALLVGCVPKANHVLTVKLRGDASVFGLVASNPSGLSCANNTDAGGVRERICKANLPAGRVTLSFTHEGREGIARFTVIRGGHRDECGRDATCSFMLDREITVDVLPLAVPVAVPSLEPPPCCPPRNDIPPREDPPRKDVSGPTIPDPSRASVDAAVATGSTSPSLGCKVDSAAEQACRARGPGFAYGPTPFIYCSGAAADTGALARQHGQAQQNQPCTCNDLQAIQQKRSACNQVPSAPPRRERHNPEE